MDATICYFECSWETVSRLWLKSISNWFEWNCQRWNRFVRSWILFNFSKILSQRSAYLFISSCSPNRHVSIEEFYYFFPFQFRSINRRNESFYGAMLWRCFWKKLSDLNEKYNLTEVRYSFITNTFHPLWDIVGKMVILPQPYDNLFESNPYNEPHFPGFLIKQSSLMGEWSFF